MAKKPAAKKKPETLTEKVMKKITRKPSSHPILGVNDEEFENRVIRGALTQRDRNKNKWAFVDKDSKMNTNGHYNSGVMVNPSLGSYGVDNGVRGCGSRGIDGKFYIGLVKGDLIVGAALKPKGLKHFGFKNNGEKSGFTDAQTGELVTSCKYMQLNPDGTAVYIPSDKVEERPVPHADIAK